MGGGGGNKWLSTSDKRKIDWLPNGIRRINFQFNVNLSCSLSLLSPNQTVFSFLSLLI